MKISILNEVIDFSRSLYLACFKNCRNTGWKEFVLNTREMQDFKMARTIYNEWLAKFESLNLR